MSRKSIHFEVCKIFNYFNADFSEVKANYVQNNAEKILNLN